MSVRILWTGLSMMHSLKEKRAVIMSHLLRIKAIIWANPTPTLVSAYILITYFVFLFGPMRYDHINLPQTSLVVFSSVITLVIGYIVGNKTLIKILSANKKADNVKNPNKVIDWQIFVRLITPLYAIFAYVELAIREKTVGPIDILMKIIGSLGDLGAAYSESVKDGVMGSDAGGWVLYVLLVLAPAIHAAVVLSVYRWKTATFSTKASLIILLLILTSQSVLNGQNIGILYVVTLIGCTVFIRQMHNVSSQKKHLTGLAHRFFSPKIAISLLIIVFIAFFSSTMISRIQTPQTLASFFNVKIDKSNWMIAGLPHSLKNPVIMGTIYLSSGYRGLEYSFDYPFTPTYGLGGGFFQIRNAEKMGLKIYDRTYQYKMRDKWDPIVNWHTIFVWIANDVSLYGVPVTMGLIGFLLSVVSFFVKEKNIYAVMLVPFYVLMILFIPCNNLVLGNTTFFVAYILISLLLAVNIFNRRTLYNKTSS